MTKTQPKTYDGNNYEAALEAWEEFCSQICDSKDELHRKYFDTLEKYQHGKTITAKENLFDPESIISHENEEVPDYKAEAKAYLTALSKHIGEDDCIRERAGILLEEIACSAAPTDKALREELQEATAALNRASLRKAIAEEALLHFRRNVNGRTRQAYGEAIDAGTDMYTIFRQNGLDKPSLNTLHCFGTTSTNVVDYMQAVAQDMDCAKKHRDKREA